MIDKRGRVDPEKLADRIAGHESLSIGRSDALFAANVSTAQVLSQRLHARGIDVTTAKGRGRRTELHAGRNVPEGLVGLSRHTRVLNPADVKKVREEYALGQTNTVLAAEQLGVSPAAVWAFLVGKTYIDAGGPIASPKNRWTKSANTPALDAGTLAKLEKYDRAVALGLIEE